MGVSINGGYPHSWMVFVRENPYLEMDDLEVPLSQYMILLGGELPTNRKWLINLVISMGSQWGQVVHL